MLCNFQWNMVDYSENENIMINFEMKFISMKLILNKKLWKDTKRMKVSKQN